MRVHMAFEIVDAENIFGTQNLAKRSSRFNFPIGNKNQLVGKKSRQIKIMQSRNDDIPVFGNGPK